MVKRVLTSIITVTVLMGSVVACGESGGEVTETPAELEQLEESQTEDTETGSSDPDTGRFDELVEAMSEVFIDSEAAKSPAILQEACLMEVLVNDGITTWDWAINHYRSNSKTMNNWNDEGEFPPENILDDNPNYEWDQFLDKALPCFEKRVFN